MGTDRLLVAAGKFHGHIGPFLAVGLKMGMLANENLGRSPLSTRVEVHVAKKPPRSCTVDGIQFVTGCTLGKGNIVIKPDRHQIAAYFSSGKRKLGIRLQREFLNKLEAELSGLSEKAVIDYAFRIMDTPYRDLFEVLE